MRTNIRTDVKKLVRTADTVQSSRKLISQEQMAVDKLAQNHSCGNVLGLDENR